MLRPKSFAGLSSIISVAALLWPVLALAGKARNGSQPDITAQPEITIRLYRIAPVPNGTLAWAEHRANWILNEANIRLNWIDCMASRDDSPCRFPQQPTELTIRVVPMAFPTDDSNTIGTAMWSRGGGSVAIYYNRARELSAGGPVACIVATAIAHEIVHLLLPDHPHDDVGLMSAYLRARDLRANSPKCLVLSKRTKTLIYQEALRRARTAKENRDRLVAENNNFTGESRAPAGPEH